MLRQDLIAFLCDFAGNNGYSHIHGNLEAVDEDGNPVGEIDVVFVQNGRYCISHLDEEENTVRLRFCDGSPGEQRAMMGPNISVDQRGDVIAAIMQRVLE